MSAELSLQQILASLEARIAFHREREGPAFPPQGRRCTTRRCTQSLRRVSKVSPAGAQV